MSSQADKKTVLEILECVVVNGDGTWSGDYHLSSHSSINSYSAEGDEFGVVPKTQSMRAAHAETDVFTTTYSRHAEINFFVFDQNIFQACRNFHHDTLFHSVRNMVSLEM